MLAPSITDYDESQFRESKMSVLSLNKGGNVLPPNIQCIKDFLTSMNFEERIDTVKECCLHRKIVLFQDHSIFDLLKAEIIKNGFGNLYFPDG